jgi:pyruvate kinase
MSIQVIATIGPNSESPDTLARMLSAGMSMARLNFSWGTHAAHRQYVSDIRATASAAGASVPIIQDLSGPRVQTGSAHSFDQSVHVLTDKDIADVRALKDLQIEYIALSFVSGAADVAELRQLLVAEGSDAKIIAKIERQEALENLNEIIVEADVIMIARGDLGDAVAYETLPFVKRDILARCQAAGVPAIVATDMMASMISQPKPSRADVADVAHAVLEGAWGTMLSNETAMGEYPVAVVAAMRRVVDEAARHRA